VYPKGTTMSPLGVNNEQRYPFQGTVPVTNCCTPKGTIFLNLFFLRVSKLNQISRCLKVPTPECRCERYLGHCQDVSGWTDAPAGSAVGTTAVSLSLSAACGFFLCIPNGSSPFLCLSHPPPDRRVRRHNGGT